MTNDRGPTLGAVEFPERADLDAPEAGRWHLGGDPDRLVEIARFDQVEAAQLFPRLGEGTVGDRQLAVADPDRRGRLHRFQRRRGDVVTALAEFLAVVEV